MAVLGAAHRPRPSLTRAESLLLYAFVALPLILGAVHAWKERLVHVALAGAAAVVLLGPWVGWNLSRFEDPTTLSTAPGPVLSTASCDATYYGDQLGFYAGCFRLEDYADEEGLTVEEAAGRSSAASTSPNGPPSPATRPRPTSGTTSARLPVVMAARVARMWDLYRPGQNVRFNWQLEARGERDLVGRAAQLLRCCSRSPSAGSSRSGAGACRSARWSGMAVMISVTAAWTFGTTRYRIPADVALVVAAAVGAEALLRRRWPMAEPDRPTPTRRARGGLTDDDDDNELNTELLDAELPDPRFVDDRLPGAGSTTRTPTGPRSRPRPTRTASGWPTTPSSPRPTATRSARRRSSSRSTP